MNALSVAGLIAASLASLTVCLGALRNFMKGWHDKIIEEQNRSDRLTRLEQRVDVLETKARGQRTTR